MLVYIYSNPVKTHLVKTIDEYPGVSSWNMLKNKDYKKITRFIPVRHAYKIKGEFNSIEKYKELYKEGKGYFELKLTPYLWKNYFDDTSNLSEEEIYEEIVKKVRLIEKEVKEENNSFIGRKKLINSKINKDYKPKKKGKTPYVICRDSKKRKRLINSYKSFVERCRILWDEIKENLKKGINKIIYPKGAYIPSFALQHVALRV